MSNVLSVGAYTQSNALAYFSNDVGNSGAVQVDAPGAGVYSTNFNARYATFSGTSMATPHVAGLAALALSANSSLTAAELRTLIVDGANHTITGSDSHGGINAAVTVALAAAGQTSATASTSPTTQSVTVSSFAFVNWFHTTSVDTTAAAAIASNSNSAATTSSAGSTALQSPITVTSSHDSALLAVLSAGDDENDETADNITSPAANCPESAGIVDNETDSSAAPVDSV